MKGGDGGVRVAAVVVVVGVVVEAAAAAGLASAAWPSLAICVAASRKAGKAA